MNSQRLEQIVAELMRPISDVRRNFDTDLSALLEEYLTEAGLHALDAEEGEAAGSAPNFAELALLLQQSACIYSRKVDFLYQHVVSVSESLQNSTSQEEARASSSDEPQTPRRRRRASQPEQFAELAPEPAPGARRPPAPGPLRPPPTLPRVYAELEPRVLADCDVPLRDYAGEPIGLLADFHVTWRLQEGLLVEELVGGNTFESSLRALPLNELQAAIEAAAPPSPLPCHSPPSSPAPHAHSTPAPTPTPLAPTPTPPASTPTPLAPTGTPPPNKCQRKRRSDVNLADIDEGMFLTMAKKICRLPLVEFSIPSRWAQRVVRARKAAVLQARRHLLCERPRDFRGFDHVDSVDIGGFLGWTTPEVVQATLAAERISEAVRRLDESDDDGFFDQSSLGDSDASRHDECAATAPAAEGAEWWSWRAGVTSRAAASEARGADVSSAARALLAAASALPAPAAGPALLASLARPPADLGLPKMFLATLFLANAGNIEIIQGPPLTMNSFSVRVLSTDERLYRTVAAADEQFLR